MNDGTEASDPSNMTVTVVSEQTAVVQQLMETSAIVNSLDPAVFPNKNAAKALVGVINDALTLVQNGQSAAALDTLQNAALKRIDGCALRGAPDKNDWITVCTAQIQVYNEVMEAIILLQGMAED